MALTWPAVWPLRFAPWAPMPAGPTAVQVLLEIDCVGSRLKIRNCSVDWSATGSPRPVPVVWVLYVIDQAVSDPGPERCGLFVSKLVITSSYVPAAVSPTNAVSSGWNGVNVPKNGRPPFLIGVGAESEKTVFENPCPVPVWPTPLNRVTC